MEKPLRTARRPWSSPVRLAQRALIYVSVAYVTLCVFLYLTQDKQIYPGAFSGGPADLQDAIRQAAKAGLVPWDHSIGKAPPPEGYVPLHFSDPAARGTIVVFHGNGGWAGDRSLYPDAFDRRGFRTFLFEYPGYGARPGYPRETTIIADARALIRELDREGDGPIYVWGESLGSGVAASVVADPTLPVQGLVIMMPWDSIAGVALFRFPYIPVRLLMTDSYDSVANLAHFQHPICIIRGTEDPVVPAALTIHLFAELKEPKKMIVQTGYGHGDWPSEPNLPWWDDALNFIAPKK